MPAIYDVSGDSILTGQEIKFDQFCKQKIWTGRFDNLARSRFNICMVTPMSNRSNAARKLDPGHNHANVDIRLAPSYRKHCLQSLPRPQSANEGMKDLGGFLVHDQDSCNSPDRELSSNRSPVMASRDGILCRVGARP